MGKFGPVFKWDGVHGPGDCPLCWEKIVNGQTWARVAPVKCSHLFHKVCLEGFLSHSKECCPVCYVRRTYKIEPEESIPAGVSGPDEAKVKQEIRKVSKSALAAFTFPCFSTNKYVKVHAC